MKKIIAEIQQTLESKGIDHTTIRSYPDLEADLASLLRSHKCSMSISKAGSLETVHLVPPSSFPLVIRQSFDVTLTCGDSSLTHQVTLTRGGFDFDDLYMEMFEQASTVFFLEYIV